MKNNRTLRALSIFCSTLLFGATVVFAQMPAFPTNAGLQAGDTLVTSGSLTAAKGRWASYIVTNTIFTGTVAPLKVAAKALVATNSSSLPGTITTKRLAKRKLGNKELLQIILGTNNAGIKGFDLVWATTNSGIIPLTNSAVNFVGARKKGDANFVVRLDPAGTTVTGISSLGYIESKTPFKKQANQFNISGRAYGIVAISAPSITNVFPKLPVASANRFNLAVGQAVTFKDTIGQNPFGAVTNSQNGSFKFLPAYGFGQLAP